MMGMRELARKEGFGGKSRGATLKIPKDGWVERGDALVARFIAEMMDGAERCITHVRFSYPHDAAISAI